MAASYVVIWMFNGKRSHSLIGVLSTVCAFYVARRKRPSWPVLIAHGVRRRRWSSRWRSAGGTTTTTTARSRASSSTWATSSSSSILESLNVENDEERSITRSSYSYETEEYGGFLLMMDTVPEKSDYDYGANYLRIVSTFIPRIVWPDKPLFGRDKWIAAWIAGSEIKRDEDFTGPAIGILGATQLNGGAVGTLIVLARRGGPAPRPPTSTSGATTPSPGSRPGGR